MRQLTENDLAVAALIPTEPSVVLNDELVARSGLSRRTVQRSLAALAAAGVIEVIEPVRRLQRIK